VVNTGSDERNHQVRELAEAVASAVPGTSVSINTDAPPDKRSSRVDFSLFRALAPDHQPRETLQSSIAGLVDGLRAIGFADQRFRESANIRLRTLSAHMDAGRLTPEIRWVRPR
jgi:hypothetical protein